MPTRLKAGNTWSQTRSGLLGSHTLSGTVSIAYQFRAMDEGPVTVPAGTFQALRVYGNATASLPDGTALSYPVTY